jgi:glycosyltransferase involved in cell wall biosynthesis
LQQSLHDSEEGKKISGATHMSNSIEAISQIPKVTVLICTLNEAENIPHVLQKIGSWVDEILVVDGHSTDGTVSIARECRPDIRVLYQPGRGKGDALRCGVQQARGDIVITMDADGETDPTELPAFVQAMRRGYDLAKGSRLAQGRPRRMPLYRWVGNKILVLSYNILYGTRFTDVCSGYNAFRKDAFLRLTLTYDNCEMEQQLLARASKAGMRILEVLHHSDGRMAGTSKVSGIKQGFVDLLVILRERFIG